MPKIGQYPEYVYGWECGICNIECPIHCISISGFEDEMGKSVIQIYQELILYIKEWRLTADEVISIDNFIRCISIKVS